MKWALGIFFTLCFPFLLIACVNDSAPTPQAAEPLDDATYKEISTPGKEHKILASLLGSWKAKTEVWLSGESEPVVSLGYSEQTWVLDGRYIQEQFAGRVLGQKFNGLSLFGYDKIERKYTSVWADTLSTGIMHSKGTFDADCNCITLFGQFIDPVTRKLVQTRARLTFDSADQHTFDMFEKFPETAERQNLRITYTRRSPNAKVEGDKSTQESNEAIRGRTQ